MDERHEYGPGPFVSETEMRDSEAPSPESVEDLAAYIEGLVRRPHDYGTCVYAMSLAANAAFNFVAGQLGVSGFQASCADLDFLRRTRRMEDRPFAIVDGEKLLFPQYDIRRDVERYIKEWTPWAAEKALEFLSTKENAAPRVVEHWKKIAMEDA